VTEHMSISPQDYTRWRQSRLGAITEYLEHKLMIELAQPSAGRKVLDVGCGDGALAEKLAVSDAQIAGIDPNPDMVEAANRRGCGRFYVADGGHLPFPDGSFDLVVAVTVLCVSGEPERLVAEMARVLRPGGRLVIGELGRWSLWTLSRRLRALFGNRLWQRAHFFTKAELTALVTQEGLKIQAFQGAVYYPPIGLVVRPLSWIDPIFSRFSGGFGAAFIAASAKKPDRYWGKPTP